MQQPDATVRYDDRTVTDRLSGVIVMALLVLWCVHSLNGFRGWWMAIDLSDADAASGVRQVLYAGSAAVVAILLIRARITWVTIKAQWRLVLLAAWMFLTVLYSDAPKLTFTRAVLFACGATTACALAAFIPNPLRRLPRFLAYICAAAAIMSIAWWAVFPASITTNPGRTGLAGIATHPNTLGPAMALGLILSLGYHPNCTREKAIRVVMIVSCSAALLMTTSITSLALAVIGVLIMLLMTLPPALRLFGFIMLGAMTVALLALGLETVSGMLFDAVNRDETMSGRDQLWTVIVEEIRAAPFFGHGWGAFWTEGKGRELVGTWNPRQSHNAYLDVLLELGIVGGFFMAVLIIPMLYALIRGIRDDENGGQRSIHRASMAAACSFLVSYAFQQSFLGKVDVFAFLFILVLCAASAAPTPHSRPHRDSA